MTRNNALQDCDTLMLDMDGTLLDLAYDSYMWLQHIPAAYASARSVSFDDAYKVLYAHYLRLQGQLDWYCLDHWSERLGLDILALHRDERARIGWLPGAEAFLQRVTASGMRVMLVTNSHRDTLQLKSEMTGIGGYFESVHTAHDFGFPKEERQFWASLAEVEEFDPARTMFVDDTETVLASAQRFGLRHLVRVTQPDTSRDASDSYSNSSTFTGVAGVTELY